MKYGFIGAGNMCSAIISGMPEGEIYVYDICESKCAALASKAHICRDNAEVIANADMLIIGVKPNILLEFLAENSDIIKQHSPLIISLAVGKKLAFIEQYLTASLPIVRVMPNINSVCLASTTGYCCNKSVNSEQKQAVERLFASIGTVSELADEGKFPIFAAVAGSSPAFCYMYIDALARAAQKAGLPREQALSIAAETVLGSAKMVLNSNEHPYALIDRVCSPGGTTIEGIAVLQKQGMESMLADAVDAVLAKDKLLSK